MLYQIPTNASTILERKISYTSPSSPLLSSKSSNSPSTSIFNLQSPSASTKLPDEGLPIFCRVLVVVSTGGIEEVDRGIDIQPQAAQDTTKKPKDQAQEPVNSENERARNYSDLEADWDNDIDEKANHSSIYSQDEIVSKTLKGRKRMRGRV